MSIQENKDAMAALLDAKGRRFVVVLRSILLEQKQQGMDGKPLSVLEEMSRLDQELGLIDQPDDKAAASLPVGGGASSVIAATDANYLAKDVKTAAAAFSDMASDDSDALALDCPPTWVRIERDRLLVGLADRSWVSCPLWWFPRLVRASSDERNYYELNPFGIHWPAVDEDIGVVGLLVGCGDLTNASGLRAHFMGLGDPSVVSMEFRVDAAGVALSDGRCLGVILCAEST